MFRPLVATSTWGVNPTVDPAKSHADSVDSGRGAESGASVTLGQLCFTSGNGDSFLTDSIRGHVTLREDDATDLVGLNRSQTVVLTSAGSIQRQPCNGNPCRERRCHYGSSRPGIRDLHLNGARRSSDHVGRHDFGCPYRGRSRRLCLHERTGYRRRSYPGEQSGQIAS